MFCGYYSPLKEKWSRKSFWYISWRRNAGKSHAPPPSTNQNEVQAHVNKVHVQKHVILDPLFIRPALGGRGFTFILVTSFLFSALFFAHHPSLPLLYLSSSSLVGFVLPSCTQVAAEQIKLCLTFLHPSSCPDDVLYNLTSWVSDYSRNPLCDKGAISSFRGGLWCKPGCCSLITYAQISHNNSAQISR